MVTRPDDLFPIEERLTLREKAEIYHQTVTLPLKTRLETPNPETVSAMKEARNIAKDSTAKTYADADALFADLL